MKKRVAIHTVNDIDVCANVHDSLLGTEYFGVIEVTLPSCVWISTDDAREFARRLIAASDEIDNFPEPSVQA